MSRKSKSRRAERWLRRTPLVQAIRVALKVGDECRECKGPHRVGPAHYRTVGTAVRWDDRDAVRSALSQVQDEIQSVEDLMRGYDAEKERLEALAARIPEMLKHLGERRSNAERRLAALGEKRKTVSDRANAVDREREIEALTKRLKDKARVLDDLKRGVAKDTTKPVKASKHVDMVGIGDTQYLPPSGETPKPTVGGVVLREPVKRK